jgi:hypothetical protein
MINLSDYVIRYGAKGTLINGLLGDFYKASMGCCEVDRFLLQTVFGIFFIDRWMVAKHVLAADGRELGIEQSSLSAQ